MLNIMEVHETNKMIEQEKLDVRTITMGISLLDCAADSVDEVCENIYNKITTYAKDLVSTGQAIERDYGIPIVNKRITVTPISLVGASSCKSSEDFVKIAHALDRAAKKVGVDLIGGYSALVSKSMTPAEEMLIRSLPQAAEFAEPEGKLLLDLYCGAGTIGLSMAGKTRRLIGAEIVPQAVENARRNAERNSINNAEFICADAGQAAKQLESAGERPDVIILDPPRKGCDDATLTACAGMQPERIVMISCNAATAARDCKRLEELGYALKKVRPFDLFPRTSHVECAAVLIKK